MKSEFDDFKAIIARLKTYKSILTYATNSISLSFLSDEEEKLYFFHIDPPWRIVFNGELIQTSFNYPYHDDYSDDEREKEDRDFRKWCSLTEFMRYEKVDSVCINEHYDLTVTWKNGAFLDVFQNDTEDPSYYFYDKVRNEVYDLGYRKCVRSPLKRK